MPTTSHHRFLNWFLRILIFLVIVITLILAASVIYSGVFYTYDVDELSHTQFVYLIAKGFEPYKSFHMIFTPIFSWFQLPFYLTGGFNFHTIGFMRWVMSVLFAFKILLCFFYIRSVFGRKIAFLFIPLLLLDPFTVFSGLQIRPDNLMVPLFIGGLLFFSFALKKKSGTLFFLSGFIFSLSSLVLIKIFPPIAVVVVLFFVYAYKTRRFSDFLCFISGFPIPWISLFAYYAIQGSLSELLRNIFLYAFLNNKTIVNVTSVSFFFRPNNYYLFGFPGKPLNWFYVYVFHALALTGAGITVWKIKKAGNPFSTEAFIKIITVGVFTVLAVWVFTVRGVFLQYFLPFSWLLALFSGVTLLYILTFVKQKTKRGYLLLLIGYLTAFILFARVSIEGNWKRTEKGSRDIVSEYETMWDFIPENEPTFPNALFRPSGYPLTYGTFIGDVHPYILRSWGKVEDYLEKKQVKYVFKSDYLWQYLDLSTKEYIDAHYELSPKEGIFIRKYGRM